MSIHKVSLSSACPRVALASMAVLLLLAVGDPPMAAADPLALDSVSATKGASDATDFSAVRRRSR